MTATQSRSSSSWPKRDQQSAELQDLRILMARGLSVPAAARQLGIPERTAYRRLGLSA